MITFQRPTEYKSNIDIQVGNFEASEENMKMSAQDSSANCETTTFNPSCLYEPYELNSGHGPSRSVNFDCRKRLYGRFVTVQATSSNTFLELEFGIENIEMKIIYGGPWLYLLLY